MELDALEWGPDGRLAHVMEGPFIGRLVMVWPENDRFWFALDRPVEGLSDVRYVSAVEATQLSAEWGLEWIPRSRREARMEARLFGIRPEMNPSNRAFLRDTQTSSVEPISQATSPGARWIAFPNHLFFSIPLFFPFIAPDQLWAEGLLAAACLLVGAVSAALAVRCWFLKIVITENEVIVHGWAGVKRIPRDRVVGFSVGEYEGGAFGVWWSTYDHNFVSLRAIGATGSVTPLHAIFGSRARTIVGIAEGLDAYIQNSGIGTRGGLHS